VKVLDAVGGWLKVRQDKQRPALYLTLRMCLLVGVEQDSNANIHNL
jgi:hypothetical protein